MTESGAVVSVEEIQKQWLDFKNRVGHLEADKSALQQENKALREMLETVIAHRQKSHSELVMLLTTLVSKLPINEVGVIVSRLMEHNTAVAQFLTGILKGTVDSELAQPLVLKTLDETRRELTMAIKPLVDELMCCESPFEPDLIKGLVKDPEQFFSPRMLRANRCFLKGQVSRERVVREFGEPALALFNDMTTDPKLNPRPKPDEIVLSFKNDLEALLPQQTSLSDEHKRKLLALHQCVQKSKTDTDQARTQKNAFLKLSFFIELLHYYEHQNTEPADIIFAQRLPALTEQLLGASSTEKPDEDLVKQVEALLSHIINPDHRHMVINNISKGGGPGTTYKYVLRLRESKVADPEHAVPEFVKLLLPTQKPPPASALAPVLRLIKPEMQKMVLKAMLISDRIRKDESEALVKAVSTDLGFESLVSEAKAQPAISPEVERQLAWGKIKDMVGRRSDAGTIAGAIRERLHAHYDGEEMKQSWVTLTEADPITLIRIICQLPYLASGKTDPIARTVLEVYVTRLVHEKYAGTYNKIINSLRNMFRAKADSPTLLNFLALVRWASPEAADKICADVGMPVPAH